MDQTCHVEEFWKGFSSAQVVEVASLQGHSLKFRKPSKDGSAKCDIAKTLRADDIVWGVVFEIAECEKSNLDRAEGLGYGYEMKEITVTGIDGNMINVITYYATKFDEKLTPYTWYKEHVLRGAKENNLPSKYVETIEQVEAILDSDHERHEREFSIYR